MPNSLLGVRFWNLRYHSIQTLLTSYIEISCLDLNFLLINFIHWCRLFNYQSIFRNLKLQAQKYIDREQQTNTLK